MENLEQPEENADQQSNDSESPNHLGAADIVSLESLIHVLVRNGVCTQEELLDEEQNRRLYMDKAKDISLVRTDRKERSSKKRNQGWLKRKMSKRKWTRRLGTALLGWEWKKVRNNQKAMHIENLKK